MRERATGSKFLLEAFWVPLFEMQAPDREPLRLPTLVALSMREIS